MPGAVANDDANPGQLKVGKTLQRVSVVASKFDAADHGVLRQCYDGRPEAADGMPASRVPQA